jgi:Tfp pilus assembly PilM family ATPase
LEWDTREARVAVASVRARQAIVEQAFRVPLESRGDAPTDAAEPGRRIATALAERDVGRVETLVALGRASIELKALALPPAADDALPGLVRFQAVREFNALGDDWPLDFVPLDDDPAAPRNVLAAAVAPDLVRQIRQTCEAAELTPSHLVLRPCAAASLFTRHQPEGGGARLLVDLLAEEADLTVLVGRRTVFLRTARVRDPLSGPEGVRSLAAEIRRTLAAVHHQLGELRVEGLHLCGAGPALKELAEQLARELDLPCVLFDPWQGVPLGPDLQGRLPDHSGRFAPLLGMLLDEAAGTPHAIDFLSPRRPPAPPSRKRLGLTIGGGVAAAAAVLALAAGWRIWGLSSEVARLKQQSQEQDALVQRAAKLDGAALEIEAWRERDVNWLHELRLLSERFPKAEDGMLTGLTMVAGEESSHIQLDGVVREPGVVGGLEAGVRDDRHQVSGNDRQEDASHPPYAWRFSSTIHVTPVVAEEQSESAAADAQPASDATRADEAGR